MKKFTTLFIAMAMILSLGACGGTNSSGSQNSEPTTQPVNTAQNQSSVPEESQEPGEDGDAPTDDDAAPEEPGSNILIAYFTAAENSGVDAVSSASVVTVDGNSVGVSQAVANMIAEGTGGDLFSIQTSVVYPAGMGELIDYVANEQKAGVMPELTTHINNLDGYDTIFIGFPIWWYDMPQVMYSFFEEYDFSGKTIIPFTVHNGSRLSGTPATMQELEPDADVIQDGFTVSIDNAADAADDVASWLEGLGY